MSESGTAMATVRNGASITEQQDEFNDDEINNHQ